MNAYCMWDSDGIAFPFTTKFSEYVGWPSDEWSDWAEYKKHGWTIAQFLDRLKKFTNGGGFRYAEPYPDFVSSFHEITALGVVPIVVTDKMTHKGVKDNLAWLRDIGCEPERIVQSKDKTDVLNYVSPGDVVFGIDDNAGHVEEMLKHGILAYVRTRPWNMAAHHLPRAHDLEHFAALVDETLDEDGRFDWTPAFR